jgi:hypothetical protein
MMPRSDSSPAMAGQEFLTGSPQFKDGKEGGMNILWIVNTNTFLLVLLVIMVSYLTFQLNALIRWLKRE